MARTATPPRAVRRAAGRLARRLAERPPSDARPASYADVVDGARLTLVLDDPGIGYAVRPTDGRGMALPAVADSTDEAGVLHLDLTALPARPAGWRGDVLVDGDPVWVPPSVGDSPMLPRPVPAGTHRFRVSRGRRGVLVLECLPVPAFVPVASFALTDAGVEIGLDSTTAGAVVLVADGTAHHTVPVVDGRAVLGPAAVDAVPRSVTEVRLVGDDAAATPLGRRADDLERPGAGVVLPTLSVADRPLLRLRFRSDGALVADLPR